MQLRDLLIRVLKKGYRKASGKTFLNPKCDVDRQSANDKMYALLADNEPCMISRLGTVELNCVNNYICIHSGKKYLKKLFDYITDNTNEPWWFEDHFQPMQINAGIFPPSVNTSERFSRRYLMDIPLIDILGSFQYREKFLPLKRTVQKIQLETLYPFFVERPWTRVLEGKKVLVVHPFDKSIKNQYKKRELLFEDEILPDFDLKTLSAVQSAAKSNVPFDDWFEALEYMENKISTIEFDICILGCGAYGLPLAAHVKRLGKKSVHIGGGTQLLFGIKGKRWEEHYTKVKVYRPGEKIYRDYKSLFNEHWCYPDLSERPEGAEKIEEGCYW